MNLSILLGQIKNRREHPADAVISPRGDISNSTTPSSHEAGKAELVAPNSANRGEASERIAEKERWSARYAARMLWKSTGSLDAHTARASTPSSSRS